MGSSWWAALSFPWLPGSCSVPTRLRFAALSKEDERRNFFPVGTNVSYVCRPGYENTSESSPSSTCLENLTWSQPAELCRSEYFCCLNTPKKQPWLLPTCIPKCSLVIIIPTAPLTRNWVDIPCRSYFRLNSRSISDVLSGFPAGINGSGLIFMLGNVWLGLVILEVFSNLFEVLKMFSVGHGTGHIPICCSNTEPQHEGKEFSW